MSFACANDDPTHVATSRAMNGAPGARRIAWMQKLTGILAACALACAIIDLIHGPHNGDAHRVAIHAVEFVSFFGFLCLVQVLAFRAIVKEFDRNRWLALTFLSFLTCVLSLILFVVSGGSFHGDGGPIAFSFLVFWTIGTVALPVSLIGLLIDAILRKRRRASMFRR